MGLGLSQYVSLIVYVTSIIVLGITLFYRPIVGLCFIIPLIPLRTLQSELAKYFLGKDFLDIYIIVLIVLGYCRRGPSNSFTVPGEKQDRLQLVLLSLAAYTLLSTWVGMVLTDSTHLAVSRMQDWKNYVLMFALYFVVIRHVKDLKTIKILTILILLAVLIVDYRFHNEFRWIKRWHFTERMRTANVFEYLGPNHIAAFLSQYTIVAVALFLCVTSLWQRLLLCPFILFSFYCLMYQFSRGGYVAALAALVSVLAVKAKPLLLVFAVMLCLWKYWLPASVIDRINMTENDSGELDEASQNRIELWNMATVLIAASPVVGHGFRSFQDFAVAHGMTFHDTHNLYLKVLAETGLIGLVVLLSVFVVSAHRGWLLYKSSTDPFCRGLGLGLIGCIVSILVANMFGERWSYMMLSGFFFLLVGLVTQALRLPEYNMTNGHDDTCSSVS